MRKTKSLLFSVLTASLSGFHFAYNTAIISGVFAVLCSADAGWRIDFTESD
ncbi:MAG: hypothetical protein JSR58_05830 [Verrucomicrobia bacterium]|nr:hypothetical protein [Verrucomicrobiota bacterium]